MYSSAANRRGSRLTMLWTKVLISLLKAFERVKAVKKELASAWQAMTGQLGRLRNG